MKLSTIAEQIRIAAATSLAEVEPTTAEAAVALAFLVLASSMAVIASVGYALLGGEGAQVRLRDARRWLTVNSATVLTVLYAVFAAVLISELASNTAAATLVIPIGLGLADVTGASPIAVTMAAALGSSFGFMMPISTAPNAMAYGTGQVSMRQMATAGVGFDVIGAVVVIVGVLVLSLGVWLKERQEKRKVKEQLSVVSEASTALSASQSSVSSEPLSETSQSSNTIEREQ